MNCILVTSTHCVLRRMTATVRPLMIHSKLRSLAAHKVLNCFDSFREEAIIKK